MSLLKHILVLQDWCRKNIFLDFYLKNWVIKIKNKTFFSGDSVYCLLLDENIIENIIVDKWSDSFNHENLALVFIQLLQNYAKFKSVFWLDYK